MHGSFKFNLNKPLNGCSIIPFKAYKDLSQNPNLHG